MGGIQMQFHYSKLLGSLTSAELPSPISMFSGLHLPQL